MNATTIRALVVAGAMVASGSASATPMYLNQVGLRGNAGSYNTLFYNGADGNPASTAHWDWTGGMLTMTGGFLRANWRLGNGPNADSLLSDYVTGLVIDTNTGTTTATSYSCIEGTAGAFLGYNECAHTSFSGGPSFVAYNFGGSADCEERTGNHGSGVPFRGLRSWNGTGCNGSIDGNNTGYGAFDMIYVMQDNTGSGGSLILASWNDLAGNGGVGNVNGACLNPGSASAIDPAGLCRRAHWLTLSSTVPVPAAVWMFGSAIGVLGVLRRRATA